MSCDCVALAPCWFLMSMDLTAPVLPSEVLKPLCEPFRREADCLLQLHEMTAQPHPPGECVRCFYRLLAQADDSRRPALTPLRQWIETHIEIAVEADCRDALRFPVALEDDDLESFCQRAMHRVREDTVIDSPIVRLALCYREREQSA